VTVCAVLAFGIGMILRHTAGAITALTALLFVVPLLVTLLPQAWQNDVNKWVPTYAGDEIFTTRPDPRDPAVSHLFSAWGRVRGAGGLRGGGPDRRDGGVPQADA
jgi:hypothetical protein